VGRICVDQTVTSESVTGSCEDRHETSGTINGVEYFDQQSISFSKKDSAP
jgi:hypothetical protein